MAGGSFQTSKRVPRNLSSTAHRADDHQALDGTKALIGDMDNGVPIDREYGNLGPNGSARVPDTYGEHDVIVMGNNGPWEAAKTTIPGDNGSNHQSRVTKPRKGNPFPGGGW